MGLGESDEPVGVVVDPVEGLAGLPVAFAAVVGIEEKGFGKGDVVGGTFVALGFVEVVERHGARIEVEAGDDASPLTAPLVAAPVEESFEQPGGVGYLVDDHVDVVAAEEGGEVGDGLAVVEHLGGVFAEFEYAEAGVAETGEASCHERRDALGAPRLRVERHVIYPQNSHGGRLGTSD